MKLIQNNKFLTQSASTMNFPIHFHFQLPVPLPLFKALLHLEKSCHFLQM